MISLSLIALLGLARQIAVNGFEELSMAGDDNTPTPTLKDRALSATGTNFLTGPAFATGTDLFTGPNFATATDFFTDPFTTGFPTGTNFFTGTGFRTGVGTGRFTTGFGTATRFPGSTITGPFSGDDDDVNPIPPVNLGKVVGIPLAIILGCYVILGGIVIAVFLTRQKNRKAWYGPTARFYRDGGRMVEASQPLLGPTTYGQQQPTHDPFTTPSSGSSPAPTSQYDPYTNYGQGGYGVQGYNQPNYYPQAAQPGAYQPGNIPQHPVAV